MRRGIKHKLNAGAPMKISIGSVTLSLALVLPSAGWAAIIGIPDSTVDAYFGSQSDA